MGKTALLEAAVEQAGDLPVLRTRCVETEANLAFSALGDLLRPTLDSVERLPAPQRRALRAGLALESADDGAPPSSAVVGLATLGVLADAAPALVVVDDVHWMDAASRGALLFAARRLLGEGVALLIAERSGTPSNAATDDLPVLELEGLTPDASRDLVTAVCGRPPGRARLDHLVRYSRGNPLALIELCRQDDRVVEEVDPPPPPPEVIASAYRRRLAPLGPEVGRALVVCAASFTGGTSEITAALGPGGTAALEAAESAGLLTIGDRVEFSHPLLRSTVYHDAPPVVRRAAHRSLAGASSNEDQRIWHAAAAAIAPDAGLASALERLGWRCRSRGALRESHAAHLRAAELTADGDVRAARALNAAAAA
jgi:hypothetical protein